MLDWETLQHERLRPLRRVEYDRLVEDGVFEDEHVELLRGLLVEMSPQGVDHVWVISKLVELMITRLAALQALGTFEVRGQSSYAASDDSEPEPDVVVINRQEFGEPLPSKRT